MPRVPLKKQPLAVERIISGGQTGADRGGLDAAMTLGIPHGGWCPKGRRAEDGAVPARYQLRETNTADYPKRTRRNIAEADATIVFVLSLKAAGPASRLTINEAQAMYKPVMLAELAGMLSGAPETRAAHERLTVRDIQKWCRQHDVKTLNVAGSRESKVPGLQRAVRDILVRAIGRELLLIDWIDRRDGREDRDLCPCTGHPGARCTACRGACACHYTQVVP